MTDDIPANMAEAMAEIRRLRVRILEYEARAAALETEHAMLRGTLEHIEQLMPDEPSYYTNVKPNAPPHDE